ncbi:biotin/lipoyl-binding protein, partial [Arthrospira platensis SPKY1]|nr:biotin/lipoyl-binding protein [Arthrospira platensis SPKY1]
MKPSVFPIWAYLLASAFLVQCTNQTELSSSSSSGTAVAIVPAVEAVQAELGRLPQEERLVGVVRALNQVEMYPEISAPIEGVYVKNGDFVQKGQLLVKLR